METNAQKEGAFQAHTIKVIGRTNYIVFSVSVLERSRAKLIEWGIKATNKKFRYYRLIF